MRRKLLYLQMVGVIVNGFSWTVVFSKQVCHDCRIAPICGGGCVQKAFEKRYEGNECIYGYSEKDIDDIIVSRFDYKFPILKALKE